VGSHPGSDSLFGIADMAGNAWELVSSANDREGVVLRGGGWYQNSFLAQSAKRLAGQPSQRAVDLGFRVCATLSTHRKAIEGGK
jgi:formylglycine-generating enzyme required for sulfatase activity